MNLKNGLSSKTRYVAPYEFVINRNIQEWDIEKANISVLRDMNIISEKDYKVYKSMDKQKREVSIGCLIRDNPEIYKSLSSGITEARDKFFSILRVEPEDVLYIDNDSITLIKPMTYNNTKPVQIGEHTRFLMKNRYTSFYKILFIDLLYFNDNIEEKFRLKNVNDEFMRYKHNGYFLDLILSIAYTAQSSVYDALHIINNIYKRYTNFELDVGYYREFNSISKFRINASNYSIYYADNPSIEHINSIDISYNASILRLLYKMLLKEYYQKLHKERV